MEEWLDVLLDATLDTLKMVPVLLVVYYLIELLEFKKVIKLGESNIFKGKASPVFAALFGCIPQCGFSVIATDLFTQGNLTVGALIASNINLLILFYKSISSCSTLLYFKREWFI